MPLLPPPPYGNLSNEGLRTQVYGQWFNLVQANINNLLGEGQQAVVTLNNTQMASVYAVPFILIPSPGASAVIFIKNVWVYTNSTGFTPFATGTAPIIQYGTTVHGGGTLATSTGLVTGDITTATSQVRNLGPLVTGALTGLSNKEITFSNATGAYTAGTGSSITFIINYVVLTATI